MKTEWLNSHGITDKAVIDAIMAENGRDIENAKKDYQTVVAKAEGLEAQLSERDTQIKELKKLVKDNESLTTKLTELETANATMKTDYEKRISDMERTYTNESKIRAAKAKNVKAVMALLNPDEDVDAQLKALKEAEDTAFLFDVDTVKPPSGTTPVAGGAQTNTSTEMTFADRIRNSLKG